MKNDSKFQFNEFLDLIIELVYLAVVFIVPLYFSYLFPTYNIFELSKLVVFKSFVWLLLFLTAAKIIFFPPQNCFARLKKYGLMPLIFVIGLGITIFFSINQIQSFFGSYNRQAGYLSILFYFLWFALLTFNILLINNPINKRDSKDNLEKRINRIFLTATFSGFLVALYGIVQIFGFDFLRWPNDPLLTRRTLSTFGQPNFLASWLLLVIPLSVYFIFKYKHNLLKFCFSLILLAQLVCLFFTSSRGGLVALILAIILYIIYLVYFVRLKSSQKYCISFGLLLLIICSLWGLNHFLPDRITSLLDMSTGSQAARINFFQAATDAIIKKPLFGYGIENGGEVFISYYQSDWGVFGDVSSTTDKAHNLILDIILTSGYWGLACYSILYYFFFRLAYKNIIEKKMRVQSLALLLGGAAYLFSLMFSFSIVAGELYFWLFLGLLIIINATPNNGDEEFAVAISEKIKTARNKVLSFFVNILLIFIFFIGVAWGIYYEFRVLVADYYFNQFYYALGRKEFFTAFTLSDYFAQEKANPVNQEYYYYFLADKLSDFYPEVKELSVLKVAREKLTEADKNLSILNYEYIYAKAKINSTLNNYVLAEKYFRELIRRAPYWPAGYVESARFFASEKKFSEALTNYNLALASLPDVNDIRLNPPHKQSINLYRKVIFREMGDLYFSMSNYISAEEYYQLAYRADVSDFTLFKKIADTYYLRGDLNEALQYNERGARRNPADYNWVFSIATLYKEMGNKEKAALFLEEAIKLAPEEEWLVDLRSEY